MANRIMELMIAIKGKIDAALPASIRDAAMSLAQLQQKCDKLMADSERIEQFRRVGEKVRAFSGQMRQAQAQLAQQAVTIRQAGGGSAAARQAFEQTRAAVQRLGAQAAPREGGAKLLLGINNTKKKRGLHM